MGKKSEQVSNPNDLAYSFDPVIYPRRLFVVKGIENRNIVNDRFKSQNGSSLDTDVPNCVGSCTYRYVVDTKTNKLGVLVWIVDDTEAGPLAHEAVHVANAIYTELGIEMFRDNDEHYAYLVQWITDKLFGIATKEKEYEANRI